MERLSPEELEGILCRIAVGLIRRKTFSDARFRGRWTVILDETQGYSGDRKINGLCLERRLFCYISKSWQGQPLIDIPIVVKLIGLITTENGLEIKCIVDENTYGTGIKESEELYESINIE
ncbi:MAG: hypothetical protein IJU50_08740, partial [Lachnospiraceae bacterium]|nr:hypothetical protein [Lachnospiraceae bacterium]